MAEFRKITSLGRVPKDLLKLTESKLEVTLLGGKLINERATVLFENQKLKGQMLTWPF